MNIQTRRGQSTTILTNRCTGRTLGSTLSFLERYDELHHDLELPDWRCAERMQMTYGSLERQLERHDRPVSAALRSRASAERTARTQDRQRLTESAPQ